VVRRKNGIIFAIDSAYRADVRMHDNRNRDVFLNQRRYRVKARRDSNPFTQRSKVLSINDRRKSFVSASASRLATLATLKHERRIRGACNSPCQVDDQPPSLSDSCSPYTATISRIGKKIDTPLPNLDNVGDCSSDQVIFTYKLAGAFSPTMHQFPELPLPKFHIMQCHFSSGL